MAENKYNENNIQELFGNVDEIVSQMESGELSLEDSFKAYKEATMMLDACKNKIETIEKELEVLTDKSEE